MRECSLVLFDGHIDSSKCGHVLMFGRLEFDAMRPMKSHNCNNKDGQSCRSSIMMCPMVVNLNCQSSGIILPHAHERAVHSEFGLKPNWPPEATSEVLPMESPSN